MSDFEVRRSTTVAAPASAVYARLIDFTRWTEWSPWEGLDPELSREYSSPSGGVGAHYAWSGNRKAGQGRMEVVGATDASQVQIALEFLKPFKAQNSVTFTLTSSGDATEVVWSMRGTNDTVFKRLFAKVFNMDKVVGGDFEKGLAALKAGAESDVA
jgi:hypothetical protein